MKVEIQYAVVHKQTGAAAVFTHQDDEETPLVAETLKDLIFEIEEWTDMVAGDALQDMEENGYKIVKQEVKTLQLSASDLAYLEKKKKAIL